MVDMVLLLSLIITPSNLPQLSPPFIQNYLCPFCCNALLLWKKRLLIGLFKTNKQTLNFRYSIFFIPPHKKGCKQEYLVKKNSNRGSIPSCRVEPLFRIFFSERKNWTEKSLVTLENTGLFGSGSELTRLDGICGHFRSRIEVWRNDSIT